jgi:hypothetical protein
VNLGRNESVMIVHSSRRSLILISRYLGNAFLEDLFALFDFRRHRVNFCSISIEDLSLLESDSSRTILSSESLRIECEDWLAVLIELGDEYSTLFDMIHALLNMLDMTI